MVCPCSWRGAALPLYVRHLLLVLWKKSDGDFVKDISASAYWGDLTFVGEHVAEGVKTLERSDEWYKTHNYANGEE